MSYYTNFELRCTLDNGTPQNIINIIEYMLNCNLINKPMLQLPNHLLFKTEHVDEMLIGNGSQNSSLVKNKDNDYELVINSCVINYNHEIELFLDFIFPYTINTGLCGWMKREDEENLTLIFCDFLCFKTQKIIKVKEIAIDNNFMLDVDIHRR